MDINTGNKEIDDALREFETKLKAELETQAVRKAPDTHEVPTLALWLIRHSSGVIKNQRQAEYVLLGFVVVAMTVSGLLLFRDSSQAPPGLVAPPGYHIVYPPNAPPRLEIISE